jgi:hypothetical protein
VGHHASSFGPLDDDVDATGRPGHLVGFDAVCSGTEWRITAINNVRVRP